MADKQNEPIEQLDKVNVENNNSGNETAYFDVQSDLQGKGSHPKRQRKNSWVFRNLATCLVAAILFTACYGYFQSKVDELRQLPLETEENVGWLYQNTYVLYRDLYNKKNQTQADYLDIYLKIPYAGLLLEEEEEREEYMEQLDPAEISMWANDAASYYALADDVSILKGMFRNIEEQSGYMNRIFGYVILDNQTGDYVTNMSDAEIAALDTTQYSFMLSYVFDSAGNAAVGERICGQDTDALRKLAAQAPKSTLRVSPAFGSAWNGPVDCTVTYVISERNHVDLQDNNYESFYINLNYYQTGSGYQYQHYNVHMVSHNIYSAYVAAGVGSWMAILLLLLFVEGILLPVRSKPWLKGGVYAFPLEVLFGIGILNFSAIGLMLDMVIAVAGGQMASTINELFHKKSSFMIPALILLVNVLVLTIFFGVAMYLGVCTKAIGDMGFRRYIKERSLIYRIFPYVYGKFKGLYHYFCHMDLTKNSQKTIRRIVLVNAVILAVISATWLGGLSIVIVYSIVLYFILRKYVSDLQKRYGILLKAVDEMARGNLNVTIEEDLGVFEPFKPQIFKIQNGFRKAVEEEVKSQRMKAELITNVSHDLKTPLTAIITYVNLLKDPNLTEEQRQEYLAIMERKSLRLKVLIEDLFEVSKANSGNMSLDLMPVDIMNLVKQVSFEMQDKLEEAKLDVRMNLTEEKISLNLDSQKTYRIYENLFGNVSKYALKGTRVYVNGFRIDDTVVITIKNISEQELTVDVSELTERFVRGDAARNTEGSGLGLAIAKSFMEMQGGKLELEADGDLFKVTTIWHM